MLYKLNLSSHYDGYTINKQCNFLRNFYFYPIIKENISFKYLYKAV